MIYYDNIKFRPSVFEKIIKCTTHRDLRSTGLFFVVHWKTFENKIVIWKNTQRHRENQVATAIYFSAVSFNKLKPFSFYPYLRRLIYGIKQLHIVSSR